VSRGSKAVEEWIRRMKLPWKLHRLGTKVRTVSEAAKALGVPRYMIVKTIVVVDGDKTYACLVPGHRKLSMEKLRKLVGGNPRLATPEEVEERTGFSVGGVPPAPLPSSVTVIVDREVAEMDKVYGGGGDDETLLELRPRELIAVAGALVADIAE
jgi:prolyl-tRNA editing enzyme YbaK/EbsC (Cys-tRNA(Pro) deacylase)